MDLENSGMVSQSIRVPGTEVDKRCNRASAYKSAAAFSGMSALVMIAFFAGRASAPAGIEMTFAPGGRILWQQVVERTNDSAEFIAASGTSLDGASFAMEFAAHMLQWNHSYESCGLGVDAQWYDLYGRTIYLNPDCVNQIMSGQAPACLGWNWMTPDDRANHYGFVWASHIAEWANNRSHCCEFTGAPTACALKYNVFARAFVQYANESLPPQVDLDASNATTLPPVVNMSLANESHESCAAIVNYDWYRTKGVQVEHRIPDCVMDVMDGKVPTCLDWNFMTPSDRTFKYKIVQEAGFDEWAVQRGHCCQAFASEAPRNCATQFIAVKDTMQNFLSYSPALASNPTEALAA